ncbi:alpha/beta hydrolase [Brevibacillus migulae]|uniref:alpha/beta hydrolase n=1 Tax=Brevibacillus migulae TaxID=1644114 RepID=UPI00106DE8A2|nr:alpha/beta fold hydrolase [Brevibacillus migulae]
MAKEHVWIKSRGMQLSAMMQLPTGVEHPPVVVIAHGFTGEKVGGGQRLVHIANALEQAGYASIRFDFAGSGDSEGTFAAQTTVSGWIEDLHEVVQWTAGQPRFHQSHLYLLGHSLGGAIVLLTDVQGVPIAGRIALAPVINLVDNFRETIIGPKQWAEAESGKTISHFYGSSYFLEPTFVHDLLESGHDPVEASKSYQAPVLLIHGTQDAAVPAAGSRIFYEQYHGPKELLLVEEGDHGFTSHLPVVIEKVLSWLSVR